jgi:hypothetical protein
MHEAILFKTPMTCHRCRNGLFRRVDPAFGHDEIICPHCYAVSNSLSRNVGLLRESPTREFIDLCDEIKSYA